MDVRPIRLALEMVYDRADTVDAGVGILGFAIPYAPVQPLDLGHDHCLRLGLHWVVSWKCADDLL